LNENGRIVLNLGSVDYLDSTGLETLIALFISARNRKAEIKFAALPNRRSTSDVDHTCGSVI
jgi:anti-anti-sigma regulatory factor